MAFVPFEQRKITPEFATLSNATFRQGISIQPDTNYNKGGLGGALQYIGGKALSGTLGTLEGIYDFTVGGIAQAAGNKDLAKQLMGNQIAGNMNLALDKQYNPSKGMSFVGDVASGVGQSLVGMGVAAGTGAISGGTLSPFVIGMISGGTIGLGAAGQATAEAYQKTGELGGREFLYGGVSGLLEGSLEALTGSAGKVASRIVSPFAKTTAKTVVRQGILKTMVKEGAGEFIEEALSTFIDPYLQRGLKIDENAENASIGDILYSGLVGFTSGALLSGASTSAMNIRKADVGAKVITNGNVDKLVTNARGTVAYATENKQIKEQIGSLQATLNTYENLKDKSTTRAKILLGELSQGLAVSDVSIQVDKIKQNIVANAEKYATYFTNKGVSITAEEIKADKKDVATKLAVMEYSGKFALSENDYNKVSDKGAVELDKDGFRQWQNNLDNSTSQRLSSQLGVDVKGVDYDTVKNAVQRYNTQQQAIQQPTVPSGDIIKPNTLSATNLARNANNTATTQSSEQAIVLALQDKAVSAKEINDINTFIKDKNVKVSYYYDKSQGAADGVYINGVLEINLASKEGVFNTAIHEYAHYLEETSPKLLEDYLKQVDKLIETNPKYKAIADKWTEIYRSNEKTKGISPKDLRVEIALKISKELIDNNADFKAIVNKDLTVGQRLLLWFKNMFNRFNKYGLTAEARAVKKAVEALQKAIKTKTEQKVEVKTDTKFSLPFTDSQGRKLTEAQLSDPYTMTSTTNNLGEPLSVGQVLHHSESQLRDKQGRLREVYHGTNEDFNVFDPKFIGMSSGDSGFFGRGFYFAYSQGEASMYGRGRIIPAYLNIKNPFNFQENLGTYNGNRTLLGDAPDAIRFVNFARLFPQIAKDKKIDVVKQGSDTYAPISLQEFAKEYKKVIDTVKFTVEKVETNYGEEWVALADKQTIKYTDYKGKDKTYTDYKYQKRFNSESDANDKLYNAYEYLASVVYDTVDMYNFTRFILDNGEQFTQAVKDKGYDGIIQSISGDEVVAFYPNQIKLTTNLNPTENEDIRYSLPESINKPKQSSKNNVANLNPERSEGELSKYIANNTRERVYAKTDAEAVLNEIINKRLDLGGRYGAGFTNAKSLDEAVNSLWIALNRATKANQINIAVDIADYILESVVLTDFYKDDALRNKREDAENKLSTIRPYYRKISARSLDAIAEDVRYAFGDTKSFAVWKATNEGLLCRGVAIDALPDVLREEGIQIKAENAQDIFIELETIRQEANATLQASKEAEKVSISQLVANGAISKDALSVMQNEIAYKIMDTFASGGDLSTYGKLLAKVKDTTKALRNALEQEKERSNSLLKLYRNINYVKNLGKYTEASSPIPEEIKAIIKPISQIVTNKGNLNQNVRTIMRSYAQQVTIDGTEQPLYNFMFDGTNPFAYQINAIAQGKGQLTIQEIQWMNDIVKSFIFGVKNYNRVLFDNKKQEAIEVSEVGIKETNKAKAVTDAKVLSSINTVKNWMSAPIWRFQRLGMYNDNSVAVKMFNELKKGVDRQSQFNMNVANHFNPFFKKYKKEVNSWRTETMTVGTESLIEMYPNNKLTKGQAISLYLLSQREQAKGHLYNIGNGTGKVRVVLDKAGLSGRKAFQGGTDIGISEADIQTLYDKFGEAEKEFVKLAQELFDTIARDAKVETDMMLYGVSNVEEGHYFPIRVSSDELFKELGKSWDAMGDLFTVYSPSFNKQTQQNAKNKIVIENVLDVVNRHARQMSAYYGLATPIKMISKIFNVKHDDGSTLRKSIAEIDPDFERYINKLFIDIQGNVPAREGIDKFVSKVRSMGATAALGLNPKVLMNQFVSLLASHGNGISYKNIALGFKSMFARNKAAGYEILYKYSPMAYDRAREGSNIDVGLLKAEAGFVGKMNKLSEITTGIIGKVDSLVVFGVWNAAIEQTRNDSNYEYKSDAHYKEAAKLLDDTIIKTQANYIPLYRPEILRQQNSLLQLSTMFMSEPLQVFSQLAASVERANLARYELKNAKTATEKARAEAKVKSANKYARGVATAVIVDSIVLSLIAILANYVKGKDDEEEFWEQFGKNMLENAVGMFPFVRDIYSYMQGYDVSNMFYTGLENIGSVFTNGKKIFTGDFTVGDLRKTVVGVAQTFGIPLRNLETYTMGAVNLFSPETAYKYWDIFYKQNYRQTLNKAVQKNDDKMAKTVLANMVKDKGVTVNDKATAEMLRLYKLGLDTIPKALNQNITIDGESRTLTNSQYKRFVVTYGKASTEINKLMSTVEYSSLDDEGKAKAIRYVYEGYYNKGLKETLGIESKTTATAYLFDITQYSIYKAYASTIESDKDKKGKTINGSKKKKIIAYIQRLNIPNAQKALLLYLEGYTILDGELRGFTAVSAKRAATSYINGSSLSTAEKEALMVASGLKLAKNA